MLYKSKIDVKNNLHKVLELFKLNQSKGLCFIVIQLVDVVKCPYLANVWNELKNTLFIKHKTCSIILHTNNGKVQIMDVETFAIDITPHCPQGSIVAKEWQKGEIEL